MIEDVKTIIDHVKLTGEYQVLHENHRYLVVGLPTTNGLQKTVIDKWAGADSPSHKEGTVEVFGADAFNTILADQSVGQERVTVYIDETPENPTIEAVFDGHGPTDPGFGDHRLKMLFRPTPQWKTWLGNNGKMLPQMAFAEFIEDNLGDIQSPPGATMLEIAQFLTNSRSVRFKAGVKLSSGSVQFLYEETDQAKAGNMDIPMAFKIGIEPFFGSEPYSLTARFRWRMNEGALQLGYKLQNPERVIADVIRRTEEKVKGPENVIKVYGVPPPGRRLSP